MDSAAFSLHSKSFSYNIKLQICVGDTITIHPDIWNHMSNLTHEDTNRAFYWSSPQGAWNDFPTSVHYNSIVRLYLSINPSIHPSSQISIYLIRSTFGQVLPPTSNFQACLGNGLPGGFTCFRVFSRNVNASAPSGQWSSGEMAQERGSWAKSTSTSQGEMLHHISRGYSGVTTHANVLY